MSGSDAGAATRSGRGRVTLLTISIGALAFLALLAFGLTRNPQTLPSVLIEEPAAPFRLETLAGGDSLGLEDFRGRVVLLNFWASWCIPCRAEHEVLLRASRTYPPDRFAVLGVLYQDTPENGRRFMSELGGDWPSVVDAQTRTAIDYGVYGVPESFFLTQGGMIAYKQVGPVTWPLVRSTVDSLLAAWPDATGDSAWTEPLETAPVSGGETSGESR